MEVWEDAIINTTVITSLDHRRPLRSSVTAKRTKLDQVTWLSSIL